MSNKEEDTPIYNDVKKQAEAKKKEKKDAEQGKTDKGN